MNLFLIKIRFIWELSIAKEELNSYHKLHGDSLSVLWLVIAVCECFWSKSSTEVEIQAPSRFYTVHRRHTEPDLSDITTTTTQYFLSKAKGLFQQRKYVLTYWSKTSFFVKELRFMTRKVIN